MQYAVFALYFQVNNCNNTIHRLTKKILQTINLNGHLDMGKNNLYLYRSRNKKKKYLQKRQRALLEGINEIFQKHALVCCYKIDCKFVNVTKRE